MMAQFGSFLVFYTQEHIMKINRQTQMYSVVSETPREKLHVTRSEIIQWNIFLRLLKDWCNLHDKYRALYLVKCNLTKLTTTSLAVKRFINVAVKRFTSVVVKRFTSISVMGAWNGGSWLGCGDLPAMGAVFYLGAGWPQWKPLGILGTHLPLKRGSWLILTKGILWNKIC